jgi:hypothetical protein
MPSFTQFVDTSNFADSGTIGRSMSAIRDAFLTCSFTRTTQSGSVNDLYSLAPRGAANSLVTYDIFAFNDAWQGSNPLFIKVRYLSGVAANAIRLDFQMGTAHNSSGSLTGTSILAEVSGTATAAHTPTSGSPVFASGDGSYMSLISYPTDVTIAQLAVFERLYDNNGNPTGSGFHMVCTSAAAAFKTIYSQMAFYGSAPAPQEDTSIPNSRPSLAPAIYNGRLILGLVYPMAGLPQNPSPNILIGTSADFTQAYQTIRYNVYGTERLYRHAGDRFAQATSARTYADGRYLLRAE